MSEDDTERLSCWRWKRDGCDDTFWSHYPGASEQYDGHEATILSWDVETGSEPDGGEADV